MVPGWYPLLPAAARLLLTCWCSPRGHPLVSHFVTEKYLWSFRPLTGQSRYCALCVSCTYAIAQASSGLPPPPSPVVFYPRNRHCCRGAPRQQWRNWASTDPGVLKVRKTTVRRGPVLGQAPACVGRTVPKEPLWQTCPYLTLTTSAATGRQNTMCRRISACSGRPQSPSWASGAVE